MFGPYRQDQISQDFTVRIQRGVRRDQSEHASRGAQDRHPEEARKEETQERLQDPAGDPASEIKQQKMFFSNGLFDRPAKHVETEHVHHEVPGTGVEKLKSEQLPKVTIFQALGAQSEISPLRKSSVGRIDFLKDENRQGRDQDEDGRGDARARRV